jgi:UDP-N-acetylglucosamine transferase subunit ALG13
VIFVTVGAQMPFDRLVRAIDQWALQRGRGDVFAQIGPTDYRPSHIEWTNFIEPAEFERRSRAARAIIAHAGTGSIITALQLGKPMVIMPRRSHLRETRNEHQVATATHFARFACIQVAWDEAELPAKLDATDLLEARPVIGAHASAELLHAVRAFIDHAALDGETEEEALDAARNG